MIQTIDLNKMGLSEIGILEMENIDGGRVSAYGVGHAIGAGILGVGHFFQGLFNGLCGE